jgi:hypothetical protein
MTFVFHGGIFFLRAFQRTGFGAQSGSVAFIMRAEEEILCKAEFGEGDGRFGLPILQAQPSSGGGTTEIRPMCFWCNIIAPESVETSILPFALNFSHFDRVLIPTPIVASGDFPRSSYESAKFPASEWLNLRWLGSHQGATCAGGCPVGEQMANVRGGHQS